MKIVDSYCNQTKRKSKQAKTFTPQMGNSKSSVQYEDFEGQNYLEIKTKYVSDVVSGIFRFFRNFYFGCVLLIKRKIRLCKQIFVVRKTTDIICELF